LACAITSKYLSFIFYEEAIVFSNATCIFPFETYDYFAILQSTTHEIWARKYASTLETRLRYTPTDCFINFPFPKQSSSKLNIIGETYYQNRQHLMFINQEGLTTTYNRFHNPKEKSADIAHLRKLHVEMDNAVAAAYGWNDLDLGHGFHETPQGIRFTISEPARREVLARLLRLNHERYEEEVRQGLHEKGKKAKDDKPTRQKSPQNTPPEGQMNLLAEIELSETLEPAATLPPTPTAEIGSWDRCKCLGCGKIVMGFSLVEHTQAEHQGKDPGYRRMG